MSAIDAPAREPADAEQDTADQLDDAGDNREQGFRMESEGGELRGRIVRRPATTPGAAQHSRTGYARHARRTRPARV